MFSIIVACCVGLCVIGFSIFGGIKINSVFDNIFSFISSTGKSLIWVLIALFILYVVIKIFSKFRVLDNINNYNRTKLNRYENNLRYKELKRHNKNVYARAKNIKSIQYKKSSSFSGKKYKFKKN